MENQRRCRLVAGLVCVLALFILGPAMAGQSQAPLAGGSCFAAAAQAPEPLWLTANGCYQQSFCPNDDYCWDLCPTADTAACVNNVCQFTLPGGGGPGGGGNQCPQQGLCVSDANCVFFGGITGTCVNNRCVC
jgi:hypothetical protein